MGGDDSETAQPCSPAAERCGGPAKPYVSSICRYLGVTAPQFSGARLAYRTATAEESLALIRQMLTDRNRSATLHRSESYPRAQFNQT
jgi:hypothetical protein